MKSIMNAKRRRLLAPLCFLGMFIIIISVFFLYSIIYDNYCGQILNQELKRLITISRANAMYMQTYYQELQDMSRTFIQDKGLVQLFADAPMDEDKRILAQLDHFFTRNQTEHLYMGLLNANGETICSVGTADAFIPPDTLNSMLNNDLQVCNEWLNKDTYVLSYGIRLYQDGDLLGVFVDVLDFSTIITQLFRDVRVGEEGSLFVCDENGTILYSKNKSVLGQTLFSAGSPGDALCQDNAYIKRSFKSKERGKAIFESQLFGQPQDLLLAFCRSNFAAAHYIVAATLPYTEAISGTESTVQRALLSLLLILTLLITLLIIVFRQQHSNALMQAEDRHLKELNSMLLSLQARQDHLHQKENLQTVGMFASSIAHDFSNLLTPILSYCEMLMLQYHTDEQLYDSLLEIYQSASSSRTLAKQLLSFSRSSKPQEVIQTKTDVQNLLCSCVKSLDIQVSAHIDIRVLPHDDPLYVLGNQSMLHQALNNLLINACQSMAQGGTLTLSCERISAQDILSAIDRDSLPFIGDGVRITVRDTGCGMDEETLRKIFNPFFSTKVTGTGTGLGLMIVKNIINQHDGWIDVFSEKGKGSRFVITLPEWVDMHHEEPTCPNRRVMVVHSHNSPNLSLYRHLQSDQEPLTFFSDPLQAIRQFIAHSEQYALLITEYQLEGFNGIALCRTLHRIDAKFPVILITVQIHPYQMLLDPASAPNEVLLNSIDYATFKASIQKWRNPHKETTP